MKIDEFPPQLRELSEAVSDIANACERFHVSCDIAEAMLPNDSPVLELCKDAKLALDEFSFALPQLARAIAEAAHRLNPKEPT